MTKPLIQGRYKILTLLGRGGMGSVYHVMHEGLRRDDALKKLHEQYTEDPEFVERFMREARAMARLDHPNIIRIYDVFADGNDNYIAMEYFAGGSLVKHLEERKCIDQESVIFIIKQVASALAYAHKQGVVHRDIKPGNVLVTSDNNVKITDFGIAAVADEHTLTSTGQMVGSPRYMSPEQARGNVTDQRSDLFSLGIVFYEMITGATVFEGESSIAIIGKLAYSEEELPLEFPDHVPESLETIIRKLLWRNAGNRFQNADALLQGLDALDNPQRVVPIILQEPPATSQSSTVVQQKSATLPGQTTNAKQPKSNRIVVASLTVGLLGLVLMFVYILIPTTNNKRTPTLPPNALNKESENKNKIPQSVENITTIAATTQIKYDQATAPNQLNQDKNIASTQQPNQPQKSVSTADAKLAAQISADLKKLDNIIETIEKSKRAAQAAAAKTYAAQDYKKAQQQWQSLNKTRGQATEEKNNNNLAQAQHYIKESLALSKQAKLAFNLAKQNADKNKLLATIKKEKNRLEALKKRTKTAKDNAIAAGAVTIAKELFQLAIAEEIQAEQYGISVEQQLTLGRADLAQQALNQADSKYQSAKRNYEAALNAVKTAKKPASIPTSEYEFEMLQRMFHELSIAYQQKDMPKLQSLSKMSDKRFGLVKKIFDNYNGIDVSIENIRLRNGVATATLVLGELVSNDGRITIPADNWKTTALEVKRQADGWSKMQWQPQ